MYKLIDIDRGKSLEEIDVYETMAEARDAALDSWHEGAPHYNAMIIIDTRSGDPVATLMPSGAAEQIVFVTWRDGCIERYRTERVLGVDHRYLDITVTREFASDFPTLMTTMPDAR